MWRRLYAETPETAVPIGHITNGIHVPTWITPGMTRLNERYIGEDWYDRRSTLIFGRP